MNIFCGHWSFSDSVPSKKRLLKSEVFKKILGLKLGKKRPKTTTTLLTLLHLFFWQAGVLEPVLPQNGLGWLTSRERVVSRRTSKGNVPGMDGGPFSCLSRTLDQQGLSLPLKQEFSQWARNTFNLHNLASPPSGHLVSSPCFVHVKTLQVGDWHRFGSSGSRRLVRPRAAPSGQLDGGDRVRVRVQRPTQTGSNNTGRKWENNNESK